MGTAYLSLQHTGAVLGVCNTVLASDGRSVVELVASVQLQPWLGCVQLQSDASLWRGEGCCMPWSTANTQGLKAASMRCYKVYKHAGSERKDQTML